MAELSPAAFAVVDAFVCAHARKSHPSSNADIASALRVVATALGAEEMLRTESKCTEGVKWCVQRIYAIADELESQ